MHIHVRVRVHICTYASARTGLDASELEMALAGLTASEVDGKRRSGRVRKQVKRDYDDDDFDEFKPPSDGSDSDAEDDGTDASEESDHEFDEHGNIIETESRYGKRWTGQEVRRRKEKTFVTEQQDILSKNRTYKYICKHLVLF